MAMGERRQSETVRSGLFPHRWTRIDDPEAIAVVAAHDAVIAGGGPAGLTAAYELLKHGKSCVVLESDPRLVGGISRTDQYKGYRFDIGGHRFFSKSDEVNRLWREILGDELITRSRLSRIYYDRKFFHYPFKPADALWKLGPVLRCKIGLSYMKAKLAPIKPERTFEDWVVNRFGRVLFEIFFKSYTEKGLGDADLDHLGRLGGPADQGPEPGQGGHVGTFWQAGGTARRGDQDLDRRVPVSAARARPDVGSGPRPDPRSAGARSTRPAGRRIEHDGSAVTAFLTHDSNGRPHPLPRPPFPVELADPRPDPGHGPARAARGDSAPPNRSSIATSSPSS